VRHSGCIERYIYKNHTPYLTIYTFKFTTSLTCRHRSVMALFSSKRTVQGRQSIQLGKNTFSKLTSYKSVKAMLFVHISLERKECMSWNNVSCIMKTYVSMCIIHRGMAYAIHIESFIIMLLITCHNTWTELQPQCRCELMRNV